MSRLCALGRIRLAFAPGYRFVLSDTPGVCFWGIREPCAMCNVTSLLWLNSRLPPRGFRFAISNPIRFSHHFIRLSLRDISLLYKWRGETLSGIGFDHSHLNSHCSNVSIVRCEQIRLLKIKKMRIKQKVPAFSHRVRPNRRYRKVVQNWRDRHFHLRNGCQS